MKGIVFTESLEMVEQNHSIFTVDRILNAVGPRDVGYTSVGSYQYAGILWNMHSLPVVSGLIRHEST